MFRPFVGHPQGVYTNIGMKRGLEIDKIDSSCDKIDHKNKATKCTHLHLLCWVSQMFYISALRIFVNLRISNVCSY